MNFRNLFKTKKEEISDLPQKIRMSASNINEWPSYEKLLKDGKVKFDGQGRLRYLHGAPVGDLILSGKDKDGKPVYRESAEDWFDVGSAKAAEFKWPD
jgi:hypothetical protein